MKGLIEPSEYEICAAYWEWASYDPILSQYLIHHVNEGKRTNGKRLVDIGLRRGIPDYQLPVRNKKYIGFWLEIKKESLRGKTMPLHQCVWIYNLKLMGHYAEFAYGLDDAIKQTKDYLANRIVFE